MQILDEGRHGLVELAALFGFPGRTKPPAGWPGAWWLFVLEGVGDARLPDVFVAGGAWSVRSVRTAPLEVAADWRHYLPPPGGVGQMAPGRAPTVIDRFPLGERRLGAEDEVHPLSGGCAAEGAGDSVSCHSMGARVRTPSAYRLVLLRQSACRAPR